MNEPILKAVPRVPILGVNVSAITMDDALQAVAGWVSARAPHYVCVTPAHSVMECHDHPDLRAIYNASGLTTPDGMAIVWLLKWKGQKNVSRVYGPDLLLALSEYGVSRGYRHYFYGGAPGVAERLAGLLAQRFPGLCVAGIESPPFRPATDQEDLETIERIRSAQPDVVWVGIGSPRQERWMADHLEKFAVPALIGVGAAFDFLSGSKKQAPRWIQRSGLEWFYRFLQEPRRLFRRYILGYPRFVWLVLKEVLTQ
jgi:N-acetylglucosaminyldiphosphoundecaprenol N-acetyl-beta-D-mannosaminyltransferase